MKCSPIDSIKLTVCTLYRIGKLHVQYEDCKLYLHCTGL